MRHLLLFVALAGLASAQSDQTPRAPQKNERGLLQVNRDHYDLAAATGGDAYFWAHGEFAASQLRIPIPYEEVVLSYGSLAAKRVFEIPVEGGVRALTLFASVQRKDLAVVVKPDGTVFDDPAGLQSYQHMLIATIEAPEPGVWKLELDGEGLFCVTAHVDGDGPELLRFEPCEVSLSGDVTGVELELVRNDGSLIARTPLKAAGGGRYSGECTVPREPYRAAVRGVDGAGKAFRRVDKALRNFDP